MFFIWDDVISKQNITSIDPNLVLYLIIKGQSNVEDFPLDQLIPTNASSAIRINQYEGEYYINGVATFKSTNIKFTKATIHIIDTPFLLTPPCAPTDTLCEDQLNWIDTTIDESIKNNPSYSTFAGLIAKTSFTPTAPYTLLVVHNDAFINGADLLKYLNDNPTALDDYMRKFYIKGGTLFPNAAISRDIPINAQDDNNTEYQLSWLSYKSVTIDSYTATPHVRNDGIYYEIETNDVTEWIPYDVPPPPVAPTPAPAAPIPSPIKPCQATNTCSAAIRLNGLQIWFSLIFFVLAVLFLI
jgi:hypothetical protein